jgi:myo-inositol-1(or 4)-monophosphatase
MRPAERFARLAHQHRLIGALAEPSDDGKARGRIGVDFGSISLCHIAAGMTDAELAKGFAVWDLALGHYILHAAGGTVIDLSGRPVALDAGFTTLADIGKAMKQRQKFIAAPDAVLAAEILAALDA